MDKWQDIWTIVKNGENLDIEATFGLDGMNYTVVGRREAGVRRTYSDGDGYFIVGYSRDEEGATLLAESFAQTRLAESSVLRLTPAEAWTQHQRVKMFHVIISDRGSGWQTEVFTVGRHGFYVALTELKKRHPDWNVDEGTHLDGTGGPGKGH